eukprot:1819452-Prymnesium_polylepis.2
MAGCVVLSVAWTVRFPLPAACHLLARCQHAAIGAILKRIAVQCDETLMARAFQVPQAVAS